MATVEITPLCDIARKLFAAMLAGCAYSWLTIAATPDAALMTNSAVLPLPIIQASIPIAGFYLVAPVILFCQYVYLHLYLHQLWRQLAICEREKSEGSGTNPTDPWLLLALARINPKPREQLEPWSGLRMFLSAFLAWAVVPFTLLIFWGAYLRRQDSWILLHVAILTLATSFGMLSLRISWLTLSGKGFRPLYSGRRWWKAPLDKRFYLRMMFIAGMFVTLSYVSFQAGSSTTNAGCKSREPQCGFFPRLLAEVRFRPWVDFTQAEVSGKLPNWNGRDQDQSLVVRNAKMPHANLRYATSRQAFLVRADLSSADLTGADLTWADLRDANLLEATLKKANLQNADLRWGVELTRANLEEACLNGATLEGADLFHANLRGAQMKGTKLVGTDLAEVDLQDANLQQAVLNRATMRGARLDRANLMFADLTGSRGLTPSQIHEAANWNLAFYSLETLTVLGLPKNHNEVLRKQLDELTKARQLRPTACGEKGLGSGLPTF